MRCWIITIGEPLPLPGNADRLLRSGIMAQMLHDRGHEVVWWTSTFDHTRKVHRFPRATTVEVHDRLTIRLLHGCSYNSNVSWSRFVNHRQIGQAFARESELSPRPDVILCSLPTLELAQAASAYGRRHNVPTIIDVRDLWPDTIAELAPKWGQPLVRLLLSPLYRSASRACKEAYAIIGCTPEYIEWGLRFAARPGGPLDREFPLGYPDSAPDDESRRVADAYWDSLGIGSNDDVLTVCFFGMFGRQMQLDSVVDAARVLYEERANVRFVLCGMGDDLDAIRNRARGLPNVILPGWVDAAKIWTLMQRGSVGLTPYRQSTNMENNIPNKPIEYLAGGLPLVSSLTGVVRHLIAQEDCGMQYREGDAAHLASVLRGLEADRDGVRRMSANARRVFENRFKAEHVYGKLATYLEQMMANPVAAQAVG